MRIDERLLGFFPREYAPNPEPFTGERMTGDISGQVAIEHYHRYLFARTFCLDKDVLDVASGEGYGSAQLAQIARSVTAVEYSAATTRLARDNFPRSNLRFVTGDARCLPLADASMDVIVSFETIEHFAGQEAFVAEVHRVLRPDGFFIISTPDRDIYSPTGGQTNEHHVRELSRQDFSALLSRHFVHTSMLYQRALIGSALIAAGSAAAEPLVFERRAPDRLEAHEGLPRPVYVVAIATNHPQPPMRDSLYIERSDIDTDVTEAQRLRKEFELSRQEACVVRTKLEVRTGQLEATEAFAIRREQILRTELEQKEVERARWECRARDAERAMGSLRTFLRGYLPRLGRHLTGR